MAIRLEAWNDSARQYDSFEKHWSFYGTVADAMMEQLPVKKDSRVLELACGTGACTLKLARAATAGKVVALDFSGGMLDVARENAASDRCSNVTFVHGDAGDVSQLLAGEAFDLAFCNSAFWHFPEPEKVLAGLLGLLTVQGEFAFSLPSWVQGSETREAFRAKVREVLTRHGVTPEQMATLSARRPRWRDDFGALLNNCGFEVEKESLFEFEVSPDSRREWRGISVFSDSRGRSFPLPEMDVATQKEVREELEAWRRANVPMNPNSSKWTIIVARPSKGRPVP
ncbi:MAG: methyltransferase domain-containing protein [Thaumarchaeota archaeon]|nr:methyltransferase domain-containing protein [Nitrososphaerota archaeon]